MSPTESYQCDAGRTLLRRRTVLTPGTLPPISLHISLSANPGLINTLKITTHIDSPPTGTLPNSITQANRPPRLSHTVEIVLDLDKVPVPPVLGALEPDTRLAAVAPWRA